MGSAKKIKTRHYSREILKYLLAGGLLTLGGGGPYAGSIIAKKIFQSDPKAQRKKTNTFYYLKKWDQKWRLIIFDIPATSNIIRDVFRGKLKEFGFYQLQKSTWIYPFSCREEIKLLREFLGADRREIQVLEASKMEDDSRLRKVFGL